MKAVREIGIIKSIWYIWYQVMGILLTLVLISPLRVLILKLHGAKIGHEAVISNVALFNCYYAGLSHLNVGTMCFIGDEVMLDLAETVTLEQQVTLSNRVMILTHTNVGYHNHPLQKVLPKFTAPVHIKRGSFIGAGAIILPGVTVGKESIVGAGSVVTKDVADRTVVAGVPARIIRKITP